MFKNALIYRIDAWEPPAPSVIEERLARQRFIACTATQAESAGWVAPRGQTHGALAEQVAGQTLLLLRIERKAVPASVVKTLLEERLQQIETETGRRPRGKRAGELKDDIVLELLPRAFAKRSHMRVWLDVKARRLLVDSASLKQAETLLPRLVELLGAGVRLSLLRSAIAPAAAMAEWLRNCEAPAGFSIDRDCALQQPDSDKASVRYARHPLDIAELAAHIEQGKLPTQLALTWNSRVSFVLTDGLALKRIKLLDTALEGADAQSRADDFDADMALSTGELRALIADLLDALGGELAGEAAPAAHAGMPAEAAQA